ncbi:caspase, EACC1-associated type [Kutzneria kofuensis]|uniref:caspase, EACC1-associated type n=1 Tax=Kutzneria kofuensis TaxID=103725 RepID=UPI0031F1560E
MAGRRTALLIVTDTHADPTFRALRAPQADAQALADVLRNPEIGGFTVETLVNRSADEVRRRLNRLFNEAERDDMILCYVSGHGVKDVSGQLHLVTTDTEHQLLPTTAVAASLLRELIDNSQARRAALWLDCCYSGAFPSGRAPKAEGSVDVVAQLTADSGRGCAVMTASTAIQYAFERGPDPHVRGSAQPSVFTDAIVRGLRTGAADLNADGFIDANELYVFVHDEVKKNTPDQTPTRSVQLVGDLYIAHSNRGLRLNPDLPAEIRQGLRSTVTRIRMAAVEELGELASLGDEVARKTLHQLSEDTNQPLAEAARATLSASTASPDPQPAQFLMSPAQPPRSKTEPAQIAPPPGVSTPYPPQFRRLLTYEGGTLSVTAGCLIWQFTAPTWTSAITLGGFGLVTVMFSIPLLRLYALRREDRSITLTKERFVSTATFSPDGSILATANFSGVTLRSTETWKTVAGFKIGGTLNQLSFSPDGTLLATVCRNVVKIWHANGKQAVALPYNADTTAFSPMENCWQPQRKMHPSHCGEPATGNLSHSRRKFGPNTIPTTWRSPRAATCLRQHGVTLFTLWTER